MLLYAATVINSSALFRPFPIKNIFNALKNTKVIAVMDRSHSFGALGGPLFHEVRHAFYDAQTQPHIINYIYGLGGRDMPPDLINEIYQNLIKIYKTDNVEKTVQFIGVRE